MDRTTVDEPRLAVAHAGEGDAVDFVRFCHRRRRVGWPELYDEMCAVAGRGLYRGYGAEDLAAIGIGFGLFQMPALAGLVAQVVAEDVERRRRSAEAIRAGQGERSPSERLAQSAEPSPLGLPVTAPEGPSAAPSGALSARSPVAAVRRTFEPEPAEAGLPDLGAIRITVGAGA